jgi:hypothetical protein
LQNALIAAKDKVTDYKLPITGLPITNVFLETGEGKKVMNEYFF